VTRRFKVWQCVGCGRIDHPQPCVGICRDAKVEMVPAEDHDAELAAANRRAEALAAFVSRIARTTPRSGEWERTYRALQNEAKEALRAFSLAQGSWI
jgi:hypothetical protein